MLITAEPANAPGLYRLRSPFSLRINATCKSTPGVRFDPDARAWVGSRDGLGTVLTRLRADYGMATKDLPSAVHSISFRSEALLRPYQQQGVNFLRDCASEGCLLADGMGLGKTVQAILAAVALKARSILVVCPNAVKLHWAKDIAKWVGPSNASAWLLERVSKRRAKEAWTKPTKRLDPVGLNLLLQGAMKPCFLICNYEILNGWKDDLKRVDMIVFDEIHLLQNPTSLRSKAARVICERTSLRIGLTGTPMANRPRDLWNPIDTLRPGSMGPFFKYALRYCGAYQEPIQLRGGDARMVWNFDGHSHEEELQQRLRYFMLRRTAREVKLELPKMTRQVIELEVNKKYRVSYTAETLKNTRSVRQLLDIAADGKLQTAIEYVIDHARAGHKVVAFTHRRLVAEMIVNASVDAGLHPGLIHGGVHSLSVRQETINAKLDVLACTIDSCSTGIDLTYADVAVFVELVYVPHQLIQAEARLNRFGQMLPVLVQYLIAQGTLDELIASVVINKIDTIAACIGKPGGLEELASDLDHREMADPLAALVAAFTKEESAHV